VPSTPAGIELAVGAAAVVAAVIVAATLPSSAGDWRLAPVLATGFWLGTWMSARSALQSAVIAYLLVDGFLVDVNGVLAWDGMSDIYRVGGMFGATAVGLLLGAWLRWSCRPSRLFVPTEWLPIMDDEGPLTSTPMNLMSNETEKERGPSWLT
jgi:hypothetical protein